MGALLSSSPPELVDPAETTKAAQALSPASVEALRAVRASQSGDLVVPASANSVKEDRAVNAAYHALRTRPHSYLDCGYPCAVFVPKSVDDVSNVVKGLSALSLTDARTNEPVRVAVCGGAHSHYAYPSGAVVIDLKLMNHVEVHVDKKLVMVGGGSKIEVVDEALRGTGLGFSTGTNGDTGVAGLTLAGGQGFLSKTYGMACDNLVEAQVVLANGDVVVATDENEHRDLMRGLRGGGGNFGIVTRFTFQLHDVKNIIAGAVVYLTPTLNSTRLVIQNWNTWLASTPDNVQSMLTLPCGKPLTITLGSALNNPDSVTTWADVPALVSLTQIQGAWFKLANTMKKADYHTEVQQLIVKAGGQRRGYLIPSGFSIAELDEKMLEVLTHFTREDYPNRDSAVVVFCSMGKALSGLPGRPHVLAHRQCKYWIIIEGNADPTKGPESLEQVTSWVRRLKEAVRTAHENNVVNTHTFFDLKENNDSLTRGEAKEFVRQLKTKLDPNNFFQMNMNVAPGGGGGAR